MAKNQTYTIQIDAELGGLQEKITRAKQALDGLIKSGNAPKGLITNFEKIETLMGKIGDKAKLQPSKGLFSGMEKDISSLELLFSELTRNINGLSNVSQKVKLDLFPPEEKQKLEAALASVKKYTDAIKDLKNKQKELAFAQKASDSAKKVANAAKTDKANIKRDKERKETKQQSLQGQVAALELEPEKNAVKIAKLKGEIAELDLEIKNLTTDYNQASKTLTETNKAVDVAEANVSALSNTLKEMETEALATMAKEAKKAGVSIENVDASNVVKTLEDAADATEKFVDETLKTAPAIAKATKETKDYGKATERMAGEIREAAESERQYQETQAKKEDFENRIKAFLGVQGAAQVMRAALRDAMQTITELDATMTDMSVVTDLSVGDYWDQLPQYTERANELGLAINDVYKADTLFYQQGLKTNEVVAVSTETMKMARISGLDTAEATNRMTAALRGFNMELNETSAQKVADVYSELAAITAADTEEISAAMTKTASIASSAGMEFETTAAFLSQIIETTRESAETAGTALKTVIARFQELKKDPSEIGEVDGEIVDANKIETALRSVGVALRDSSGQFRELDDVFLELSSKWNDLDKNTQRYIATIAAGSRQQSRFLAMMSDYGRTQELVTAANNSAGASNAQFEKTLESLDAKVERLKNAWHEFTMGIMNSDLVKFGVDMLSRFLEVINKATGAFDGLGGSMAKIASVFAIFKTGMKVFEKFRQPVINLFGWIVQEAGLQGFKAGEAWAKQAKKGAEKVLNEEQTNENKNKDEKKGENEEEDSQATRQKKRKAQLSEGFSQIKSGFTDEARKEQHQKDKQKLAKMREEGGNAKQRQQHIELLERDRNILISNRGEDDKAVKQTERQIQKEKDSLAAYQEQERITKQSSSLSVIGEGAKKVAMSTPGVDQIQAGRKVIADKRSQIDNQKNKKDNYDKAKKKLDELNKSQEKGIKDTEEYKKAVADLDSAQKEYDSSLDSLIKNEKEVMDSARAEGWKQIGDGITRVGETATQAGVGLSMLGGILSSIGLEGFGETLTFVGNALTIIGPAVMALGPIFSKVGSKITIEGIKAHAAWWWLAGIAAALGAVIAIVAAINAANSPEKKLEKANKAAEEAEEHAKAAADAYKNLADSLNSLDDKYDAMGEMVRGTDEWNKALQDVNSQVLDLIEKYPKLAGLVENDGGMLKIDVESDEVKNILAGYNETAVKAQGVALGAKAEVVEREQDLKYSRLDFAKISAFLYGESGSSDRKDIADSLAMAIKEDGLNPYDKEAMIDHLRESGFTDALGNLSFQAQKTAEYFSENSDELREYAETIAAADAETKAYYQAMALNAQKLLNMDQYSQQEKDQMSSIVDSDKTQLIKENLEKQYEQEWYASDSQEIKDAKNKYARQQYGDDAYVSGNKIVYYDENGDKQTKRLTNDEWAQTLSSANAADKIAEAMKAVPEAIDAAAKRFGKTVEKAMANPDKMTNEELQNFKASVGYNASEKGVEGSDGFTDKGREELQKFWNENEKTLSKIYGEGEEGFETYLKEYRDIIEKQEEGWEDIYKKADKLNFFSTSGDSKKALSKMSKEAANSWVNTVKKMTPTTVASGSQGDKRIDFLNEELNKFIAGMDNETVDLVMSEIGSIDITNAIEWDELAYRFEELGIVSDATEESLQGFIAAAKETSNAVVQVDFKTFNERINSTIVLLDKISEGARKYSKEEYQSFVAENSSLKDDFVQIGDEFVYLGNAIQDLEKAVKQNTVSQLREANFVLGQKLGMSEILNDQLKAIDTESASEDAMVQWLEMAVRTFSYKNLNIKNAGIEGLSMLVDFSEADKETLAKWIDELLLLKEQLPSLKIEYNDTARDANVAAATLNSYGFNAKMAIEDKEFSDQYSDSLLAQAIQLGVGEVFLQAFSNAKETYNKSEKTDADVEAFKESVEDLLQAIYAAEELGDQEEAVNTITPLVEKVIDTIEKQRQDEIDKLSEVNDSINTTNDRLISKIQEQIDSARQQRQNDEMKQDLEDLYSKQAYLAMGGTSLEALENAELIKQTEQDVQDNLVDQALQKLQDANEKAAEQRERQISLLQQQLDYDIKNGLVADKALQIVKESLYKISKGTTLSETPLGEIVEESLSTGGEWDKEQNNLDWGSKISEAVGSVTSKIAGWLTSGGSKNDTSGNGNTTLPGAVGSGNELQDDWIGNVKDSEGTAISGTNNTDAITDEERAAVNASREKELAIQSALAAWYDIPESKRFAEDFRESFEYKTQLLHFQNKGGGGTEEEFWEKIVQAGLENRGVSGQTGTTLFTVPLDLATNANRDKNWLSLPININGLAKKVAIPNKKDTEGGNNSGQSLYNKYKSEEAKKVLGEGYEGDLALYNGEPYIWDGAWVRIVNGHSVPEFNSGYDWLKEALAWQLPPFKTGGLADFTGPAWLDGTKSRPEYILNADQTKRFFSLVDILERFDEKAGTSQKSGDNYFDINITVDKIENDYDVDKMADKIREKIYEDASYRNVNAINLIR